MTLTSWFAQGGAITLRLGANIHETSIIGVREIWESSGGSTFTTADAVVHKANETRTCVGLEVRMVQSLAAADLWRYLRETASTTATLTVTGSASATEGASNPEWVYSVTGWVPPPLEFSGSGATDTPTATFWVSGNPTVDVTP